MKTSKKTAAQPNTTTITLTTTEGPEALRHERMWVVATKTGREKRLGAVGCGSAAGSPP